MVFFPFLTSRQSQTLRKRKGGGASGGGRGGGGGRGSGGRGSASKGGINGASTSTFSPVNAGRSYSASPYGPGGGRSTIIPEGQVFAGRSVGGGTRAQVYGTQAYGSGYPGYNDRGVNDRPFPFYYWPLVWVTTATILASNAYLYRELEYGHPDNASRPGGVLMLAEFSSKSVESGSFRILSDNATVISLISSIETNCSSSLGNHSKIIPSPYTDTVSVPKPEQALQYYRASTVVLTLDGYNDTSALDSEETQEVSIPPLTDKTLLSCLNETIGIAVPLVSGSHLRIMLRPSVTALTAISLSIAGIAYLGFYPILL